MNQEQVNPHFLYNILTIISQHAYSLGDKEICHISDEIAKMLRYSTSTSDRYAPISSEIDHTKNYLSLMQRRLGRKLKYEITIIDELKELKVLKIIIQPLVENAHEHGFVLRIIKNKIIPWSIPMRIKLEKKSKTKSISFEHFHS